MASGFRDLKVWQKAKQLAVNVYKFTQDPTISKDYGMVDQMRRSAVSIPSNIAEGDERHTDKDTIRFFYISKGSAGELFTQLEIISEVYPNLAPECLELINLSDEVSRMLRGLISARSKD